MPGVARGRATVWVQPNHSACPEDFLTGQGKDHDRQDHRQCRRALRHTVNQRAAAQCPGVALIAFLNSHPAFRHEALANDQRRRTASRCEGVSRFALFGKPALGGMAEVSRSAGASPRQSWLMRFLASGTDIADGFYVVGKLAA